jgi:hypothetical protein
VRVRAKEGEARSTGPGAGAKMSGRCIRQVRSLSINFIRADVDGRASAVVKGAVDTLTRDRPIFSMASYHGFSEIFNVSTFLTDRFAIYHVEGHMENGTGFMFVELSLFE